MNIPETLTFTATVWSKQTNNRNHVPLQANQWRWWKSQEKTRGSSVPHVGSEEKNVLFSCSRCTNARSWLRALKWDDVIMLVLTLIHFNPFIFFPLWAILDTKCSVLVLLFLYKNVYIYSMCVCNVFTMIANTFLLTVNCCLQLLAPGNWTWRLSRKKKNKRLGGCWSSECDWPLETTCSIQCSAAHVWTLTTRC